VFAVTTHRLRRGCGVAHVAHDAWSPGPPPDPSADGLLPAIVPPGAARHHALGGTRSPPAWPPSRTHRP